MAGIYYKPAFKRLALVLMALLLTSGCSSLSNMWDDLTGKKGSEIEVLPQELAYQGMENLNAARYSTAIETFQTLKDRYPYSKYAILAELKIADAMFLREDYEDAHEAYGEFERLHPKNEATPYVIYQQGMCFFERMTGYDREQVSTVLAIQTFTRLVQTYPDSRYSAMAIARITEAQNSLAHHEFYVGEFYYKMKAYKAAVGRFVSLVRNYPDTGFHGRALEYIKTCRQKMAQVEENERLKEEKKRQKAEAKKRAVKPVEPKKIEAKEDAFDTDQPMKTDADAKTGTFDEPPDIEADTETAKPDDEPPNNIEADAETAETDEPPYNVEADTNTGETDGPPNNIEADTDSAVADPEPTSEPQEAGSPEKPSSVGPFSSKTANKKTSPKPSPKLDAPTTRGEQGQPKPKRKPIQLLPPQSE